MRDSQRQKLYNAEKAAFRYEPGKLATRYDVGGVEGAQKLAEAVWASRSLLDEYDATRARNVPLVVKGHGRRGRGCYFDERNEIHMPDWALMKFYVLHEVAHALIPGTERRADHGWEFAACYLRLIRVFMGKGYADALEDAFKAKRVTFKPKRAYTISDAERARRAERARALS